MMTELAVTVRSRTVAEGRPGSDWPVHTQADETCGVGPTQGHRSARRDHQIRQ